MNITYGNDFEKLLDEIINSYLEDGPTVNQIHRLSKIMDNPDLILMDVDQLEYYLLGMWDGIQRHKRELTIEDLEKPKKDLKWLKEALLELRNAGKPENNRTERERELGRAQQWAWNNCIDRVYELINQLDEPEANSQIYKLADFIMREVESEPSQSQGAVDTAIRIIKSYQNQETLSSD